MAFIDVTDADFSKVVLESAVPVLVDYWAGWCTPCKQLAPILDELAETYRDRMKFVRIDTDTNNSTPVAYSVNGLPTVHIFMAGKMVKSFQGSKPKMVFATAIESFL